MKKIREKIFLLILAVAATPFIFFIVSREGKPAAANRRR